MMSHSQQVMTWVVVLAALLTAGGCAMPGDAAPVIKIGLIAPFEGVGRPLGYGVLPAVKGVLADANATGMLGRYRVALVALNDDLDPASAAAQARALAQDADVLAVLGPFSGATAAAAAPILSEAGIPALAAAPLAESAAGVRSLCPAQAEVAAALEAHALTFVSGQPAGDPPYMIFTGDAAAAADLLVQRRAEGWAGALIGGPDVLRPWLPERAGEAAEGSRAAACAAGDEAAGAGELPEAALARAGIQVLLRALADNIRDDGRPTRPGIAAALARQPLTPRLDWYALQDGEWGPLAR